MILVIQAIWLVSYLGLWRYIHRQAEQNRCRELGVLRKFQSKTFLKIHEYPSADDFEGKKNQWSVPAILLFTKNADYENEKCLKIKVFICILHSKQQKDTLFLTSTRRYENLRKVPPFLIKSGTFLGFVFDINWSNFLE